MFKKILITLIVLIVIIGSLVAIKSSQFKAMGEAGADFQLPPEFVTSAPVTESRWVQTLDAVGSLAAVQGVTVTTEAAGKISTLHFESGEVVTQGQLLVELDTSTEEAQLAAAKAEAKLAETNLVRARKLFKSRTVPEAEFDAADAAQLAAAAQVENLQAIIEKKKILAPFDGRLGIRQVDLGQFLNNGNPIVSLQSLDPIFVNFSLPQQSISKVKEGLTVELRVDAYPEEVFTGKLTAVDPSVSAETRTISLQATLDNTDEKLLPGMFATVSVILPDTQLKKIVPATSILYASYGNSVFVINEKDGAMIVDQTFVQVGEARGDFVSIVSDIEPGSIVVSTGAFKLRQGAKVALNNELNTDPQLKPDPEDA